MTAFYSEISNIPTKAIDFKTLKISSLPVYESLKLSPLLASFNEAPIDSKEALFKEFFPKEYSILNSNSNSALKDIKKIDVAFGEQCFHQVYYDKTNEIKKIDTLASDNLDQFLGYNALIPEGNTGPKKEKANEDPFDQNFNQEEEKDQFASLQIYWRFDEGKGTTINDLSDYEINGVLENDGEHDNDEIWNMLDDGDPLELEDKWGKKCPTQYGIDLNAVNVKNVKKTWFEDEVRQFTIEFWLKPRVLNGMIFEISEENFICILHEGFLKLMIKGKPMVLMEDEGLKDENINNEEDFQQGKNQEDSKKIKESFWNHLAIVYDSSQPKTVILYLNCFEIGYSNMIFDADLFKEKTINLGKSKFKGEITEFRLWKSANSLSEIKDSYRSPLEIVAEKKKKIKMKFKDKDKPQNQDIAGNDLKKFAAFLTMAPPGVPIKEPQTDRKPEKTFKAEELKKNEEKINANNDEDLGAFATYTFNVKSQNQFYQESEKNTMKIEKKKSSFEKINENDENKWEMAFATNKTSDTKKNQPEFGGFREFSSTKPMENTQKSDWQGFEFGTTGGFATKKEENEAFPSQKFFAAPILNENDMVNDRNKTASLFEKYDKPFDKQLDFKPDFNKVENISGQTPELPFENPFIKKKQSMEQKNFSGFEEKLIEKNQNQEKPMVPKNVEKGPEKPVIIDFEMLMADVGNLMERSRGFMKEVRKKLKDFQNKMQ